MQISNGIDVNSEWTDVIAWTSNGSRWNSIQTDGLSVEHRKERKRSGALNQNSGYNFSIVLFKNGIEKLKFNLPVQNQPTWTNSNGGAVAAAADINNWVSSGATSVIIPDVSKETKQDEQIAKQDEIIVELQNVVSALTSSSPVGGIEKSQQELLYDLNLKMNVQLEQNQTIIYLLKAIAE